MGKRFREATGTTHRFPPESHRKKEDSLSDDDEIETFCADGSVDKTPQLDPIAAQIPHHIPFQGTAARGRTCSVALPVSIIANAQSRELRAYLVGQIARTCTIFGVDEIVLYEDSSKAVAEGKACTLSNKIRGSAEGRQNEADPLLDADSMEQNTPDLRQRTIQAPPDDVITRAIQATQSFEKELQHKLDDREESPLSTNPIWSAEMRYFALNLSYLETPPYLRKYLFPLTSALRMCGLANPLQAPHHVKNSEWLPYREGVVVKAGSQSCLVDCGLSLQVKVRLNDTVLRQNQRVTVKFASNCRQIHKRCYRPAAVDRRNLPKAGNQQQRVLKAEVVDSREPLDNHGLWFGYKVRMARSLRQALTEPSAIVVGKNEKYDFLLGTSERGDVVSTSGQFVLARPSFRHCLIVFGGLGGLEEILEDDQSEMETINPRELFDQYVNVCQAQKSRTIRTEEALLLTLGVLRPHLLACD